MASEFLDKSGLTYLWGKLKAKFAPKTHTHTFDQVTPVDSKTFTGIIGTANNWANATFFFGTVMPTEYNALWSIRYRVKAVAAGDYRAKAISDVCINGYQDTYASYSCWNAIQNTSYRPAFYHEFYRAKSAGITAGYGHALGERLYSSWNPTTVANARTFDIEIIECINCTFTFFDSMLKYAEIPGTGSTNYNTYTEFDFANNGLQETGDANSWNNLQYYNTLRAKSAIATNTMIVGDADGYCQVAAGAIFDITYPILWITTSLAANGTNYANIYSATYDKNLNTMGTFAFTARKMVYLVVTISGNTATIDNAIFSDSLPSEDDGKVYIAVGRLGNQSTGTNYFFFQTEHPMFQYKNGAVRFYTPDFYQKPSTGIPKADLASAVQTSLGKADSAYQKPSGGIPATDLASGVQTNLDLAATAYQKPSGGIPSTDLAESYYLASNPSGYTSNTGTITGVSANGTSVATSGVANIPAASTSVYGVTKLSDSTSTTSSVLAATPTAVKAAYDLASGKYSKPSGGIPATDLESGAQTNLGLAATAYQKPSGGIPATDLAESYIKTSEKGAASGVASLTSSTKVTARQITAPVATEISAATTLTADHVGHALRVSAAVTITLPTLVDGDEVEIWNTGSGNVTLSGTIFLAGTGNVTSCVIEAYQVAGCKQMDNRWYISGGVSV